MTITRAVETWALAVLATLGSATPFTRRLDAQNTSPSAEKACFVGGCGTADVIGEYDYMGTVNGRVYGILAGNTDDVDFNSVSWNSGSSEWRILNSLGELCYSSPDNVDRPDLASTWLRKNVGVLPVPTVTAAVTDQGVNNFPQVTCRATETGPEYAIAYRTPRGQKSYGSRMTLTVTLLYDATANETTPEAADLAMADIRAAFRQPPEVDASAFAGLIVFDDQMSEITVSEDNREHVFTVELAAVLKG